MNKTEFIVNDLLSRIYRLEFRSGKLPTQRKLAAEYGVARSTIQEALRALADIGAVKAVQGSGVYIREKLRTNPLVFNSLTRMPYAKIESRMLSLERRRATDEELHSFQLPQGSEVWHFARLRIVNHEAEQIERSVLPQDLVPVLDRHIVEGSIQAFMERSGLKISHFITSYEPTKTSRADAELLGCKHHEPAMRIENRGILVSGRTFEMSSIIALDYSVTYIRPFDRAVHAARMHPAERVAASWPKCRFLSVRA